MEKLLILFSENSIVWGLFMNLDELVSRGENFSW